MYPMHTSPTTPTTWTPRRLRRWRSAKGWTVSQAATWYGVTVRAWGDWESGIRPIPKPLMLRIDATERGAA